MFLCNEKLRQLRINNTFSSASKDKLIKMKMENVGILKQVNFFGSNEASYLTILIPLKNVKLK